MGPYAEEASEDAEAPYAIPVEPSTALDEHHEEEIPTQSQMSKWSSLCFILGLGVFIFLISLTFYLITTYV